MRRALLVWFYAWFTLSLVCMYAAGINEPFRFKHFAFYLAFVAAYAQGVAHIYSWEK